MSDDETLEKLNRIANYLFLQWCCEFSDEVLKNYYADGVDAIEGVIAKIKNYGREF